MVQTGGSVICDDLEIGTRGDGEYAFGGGSITADTCSVGGRYTGSTSPTGHLVQTGGLFKVSTLAIGRGDEATGVYTLGGGTLSVATLALSTNYHGEGRLEVTSSSAAITISNRLEFGPNSTYAAVHGTVVQMTGFGGVSNMNTDAVDLAGLGNTTLIFRTGGTAQIPLEAAGKDLGPTLDGFNANFAIDTLQIGSWDFAAVWLVDDFDNQPDTALPDAVYVDHLILSDDSSLDLHGLNLYCRDFVNYGGTVLHTGGGELFIVPEPAALVCVATVLLLIRQRPASVIMYA
jgi:hypothetical protein